MFRLRIHIRATSKSTETPPLALGKELPARRDPPIPAFRQNFATVMTAPVFPALTMPSALASRTRRAATWTELSFFRRKSLSRMILHGDHVAAATISIGRLGAACLANSARTTCGWPTSKIRTPNSRAARTLPRPRGGARGLRPWRQRRWIMGCCPQAKREKLEILTKPLLEPLCPCNVRNAGRPGAVLHFVAIRALAREGLVKKSFALRVLVLRFECRRFGLGIAIHLVAPRWADYIGL